jgi:AraC-like DNA-binding protein
MIALTQLDLMARGGSLALLILWSWFLMRDHWSALPARMALLMNFSIVCHILSTMRGSIEVSSLLEWLMVLGSMSVPSFFWLFARAWFNDETRIPARHIALIVIATLISTVSIHRSEIFPDDGGVEILGPVSRTFMVGFAIAGLWTAWRGRDDDLVEARRKLRTRLVWAVGLYVIATIGLEIVVFRGFAPRTLLTFIEFGVFFLTLTLCAEMFGTRQTDLFARAAPMPDMDDIKPDDLTFSILSDRLVNHMEHNKPHRDERLTIAALARQLGEQEYRIRRLINGQLGHRNFAAFLNGYRLAEVRQALGDVAQRDVPILTIALDAGFGSLGPFNRAFREAEGMTPSEYRAGATRVKD